MYYWSTANKLLQLLYPRWHWQVSATGKMIYLSFDDGPHPEITPWVLGQLKAYDAKATFFCIGNNVRKYPAVYARILEEGHTVGNHTMQHVNGWKVSDREYFQDIKEAKGYIDSKLFRPPYGRLTRFQGKQLREAGFEIVMWSVLSGDFDASRTVQQQWKLIEENVKPGAVIVYHDSEKAWDRLNKILPLTLEHFSKQGYIFESINMNTLRVDRQK